MIAVPTWVGKLAAHFAVASCRIEWRDVSHYGADGGRAVLLDPHFARFVNAAASVLVGESDYVVRKSIAFGVRRLLDPRCLARWRKFTKGCDGDCNGSNCNAVLRAVKWIASIARRHPGAGVYVFPNVARRVTPDDART